MSHNLGPKALACLRIAAIPILDDEWQAAYDAACRTYSEKAVIAMFESLCRRGYMECGISERTGWLTKKGRSQLDQAGS